MPQCTVCGEGTNMPYTCNYCGETHCKKHKLPEKHDCPNKAEANTLGPELRRKHQQSGTATRPRQKIKTSSRMKYVILGLLLLLVFAGGILAGLFLL